MIFFGMAVFALVQSRVMSLKSEDSLSAIAEERSSEIQQYLALIDRVIPLNKIPS